MLEQSYKKHTMVDPLFHFFLAPLSLLSVILGIIQFVTVLLAGDFTLASLVAFLGSVLFLLIVFKLRGYGLKLQDRLIRSEENFRYFVLTGKRLDERLSLKQLIALRFASDEEYPELVVRTLQESLTPDQIKQSVVHWRADHHRV